MAKNVCVAKNNGVGVFIRNALGDRAGGLREIHNMVKQKFFPGEFIDPGFGQACFVVGVAAHGGNGREALEFPDDFHRPDIARVQNVVDVFKGGVHFCGHAAVRI